MNVVTWTAPREIENLLLEKRNAKNLGGARKTRQPIGCQADAQT
jgi:hypothetical protein